MKREDMLTLFDGVDETLLLQCDKPPKSKTRRTITRLSAIAACLAVLIVGGAVLAPFLGGAGAGGGSSGTRVYMSYPGPVLPLTVLEGGEGITATRHIDFDLSHYGQTDSYGYGQAMVRDSYTLTNGTAEDKVLTLAYPIAESLDADSEHLPTVTVDGQTPEIDWHVGPYTGGYMGVWGGGKENEGSVNMKVIASYPEFKAVIEGGYMASAFDAYPVLDQPVTVYQITEPKVLTSDTDRQEGAPTLAMYLDIDFEKTTVLTYGLNGGMNNEKEGIARRSFFIPMEGEYRYELEYATPRYILLYGEDAASYRLQGYRDGGCDKGEEIDATATVERYETTLGEFLAERIAGWDEFDKSGYEFSYGQSNFVPELTAEDYLGLVAELMMADGPLSPDGAERYAWGNLEDLLSAVRRDPRVMYLTFKVTVPAGESVEVDCSMLRTAYMDYIGKYKNRDGYDMSTTLGSSLSFTTQTASLTADPARIELIEQNFGFDLPSGVTEVALDIAIDHYYMEVVYILPEESSD